jgi:predicted nucleic acid-binding protein
MSHGPRGPVVIDTGVFGANLSPAGKGKALATAYRPLLEGRPAVISFVTMAELRFGAKLAGCGSGRLQRLDYQIGRADDIVWPGPSLADAHTTSRAWCVRAGDGLGQKDHEADRWVATTAIWLDIPLIAHDAIFANVKGLQLRTEPSL